jgi:putative transcriptional regulator
MTAHNFPAPPSPEVIIQARQAAGLTQTEAAALIYKRLRAWQNWESGATDMDPALWELFKMKLIVKKATGAV